MNLLVWDYLFISTYYRDFLVSALWSVHFWVIEYPNLSVFPKFRLTVNELQQSSIANNISTERRINSPGEATLQTWAPKSGEKIFAMKQTKKLKRGKINFSALIQFKCSVRRANRSIVYSLNILMISSAIVWQHTMSKQFSCSQYFLINGKTNKNFKPCSRNSAYLIQTKASL